jgi:hypothetical protein
MKLQQAYLKKNNPRQYAHSTDGSHCPGDALNRRPSSRVSALFRGPHEGTDPAKSEGIACLTYNLVR